MKYLFTKIAKLIPNIIQVRYCPQSEIFLGRTLLVGVAVGIAVGLILLPPPGPPSDR